MGCWWLLEVFVLPFAALVLAVFLGLWPFLVLALVPFLELLVVYSVAPVRGGTYFLCRRKER
jgi:hypothetical protein